MKIWAKTEKYGEGKFLVVRRDGTVPHWPHFVLGARDEAAIAGLLAYAAKARELGYEEAYCASVEELARHDFPAYLVEHGKGDPEAAPHRTDDPAVIRAMRGHFAFIAVVPDKGNTPKDPTAHASTSPGPEHCNTRLRFQNQAHPDICDRCGGGPCPFFDEQDGARRMGFVP